MIHKPTTKEILGDSLRELAKKKSVYRISVKEIVDNCQFSTTTFYHHFHDKYELIAWLYNREMEELFKCLYKETINWYEAIIGMLKILDEDRSFYKNVLKNTEGPDSFFSSTHQRSIELTINYINKKYHIPIDEELMFYVKFYLRGMSYSIEDWFLNDLDYSIEHLSRYLYKAMPDILKPYLEDKEINNESYK